MSEHLGNQTHHRLDYVEISVLDLSRAKEFYRRAFGWGFSDYGTAYAGIRSSNDGGGEVGGLCLVDEIRPGGSLILLYSEDLDASVADVRAAGGDVVKGPYEFPGGRRFHFTDPSGNELGVWSQR